MSENITLNGTGYIVPDPHETGWGQNVTDLLVGLPVNVVQPNQLGNLSEATSSVLTITGATGSVFGAGTTIQVKLAGTAQDGYLSQTDWNTFNGKQNALGFTPENLANKSTSTSLGTSDTLYPSQNAVKSYVDAHIGGVPAGSSAQIQFNNSGAFGASSNLQWNDSLRTVVVGGASGGHIQVVGTNGSVITPIVDITANGGGAGFLSFVDPADATKTVSVETASGVTSYIMKLPPTQGTAGQSLKIGSVVGTVITLIWG